MELTPSFKISTDARAEGLVSNEDYSNVNCLENRQCNFIPKKYGRKRRLPCTHSLDCNFSICIDLLHC